MNLSQTLMPNIPSFLAAYFPVKIAWDLFRLASAVFNSSVFICSIQYVSLVVKIIIHLLCF